MPLKGKKILLGITGSIAAYKSIVLLRILVREGADVKVVMTPSAKDFVSPLVLSVLSKNKVAIDWAEQHEWNNHVELGRWADVMLFAPLSCNTLAKMANGLCDNLLLAIYLSATCPVVVAPSMDEDMWHHPSTRYNIQKLKEFGNYFIDVNEGELASGLVGKGRMEEPEAIVIYLIEHLFRKKIYAGKKVLITAGPTYEAIDPVRFIGNRSSGKMGFALAHAFYLQGADVVLVTGPSQQKLNFKGITLIQVQTATEMFEACVAEQNAHIIVMSAAVADYTPVSPSLQKIKKSGEAMTIDLQKTKDILSWLGENKQKGQYIAGFALETENEVANATEKLNRKNLNCIILNSLNDHGAGFEKDTNCVTIIDSEKQIQLELASKAEIAHKIVTYISSALSLCE